MAGITSHRFDVTKLVGSLGVPDGSMAVDERVRDIVDDFLLALDQMYEVVYYHHAVRAANWGLTATFKRALAIAEEEGAGSVFPLGEAEPFWRLAAEGGAVPLDVYGQLDESSAWTHVHRWTDHRDATLKDLAGRLEERRLLKTVQLPKQNIEESVHARDLARASVSDGFLGQSRS